jgi:hypothetical protein
MRLTDYFAGQEVGLRSPLPAREVAERITAAASGSILRHGLFAAFRTGVVGRIWWGGHVRLRFRSSILMYGAKPVLAGRLLDTPPGSQLRLRYRAPAQMYVFYPFWYLVLAGLAIGFSSGGFDPEISGGDKMIFAGMLVAFFFQPLIFHAIGTRNSEKEFADMVAFLAENAQARPDPML